MGGIRALFAVLLVSTTLFAAPTAMAKQDVRVSVSPSTVSPGEEADVLSTCGGGVVQSDAFEETELVSLSRDDRYTSGATVLVHSDARSSVYDVEAVCRDGRSGTAELVVSDSGANTGGGAMAGGVNVAMASAGAVLLVAAVLGWLLGRRRRSGTV